MLAESGSPWLLGTACSLADITAVPFVMRISELSPAALPAHPAVQRWWGVMQARPSFAAARIEAFETSLLARLAARRASMAQRKALQQAQATAHAKAAAADRRGYEVANAALHECIYLASGNPVLVEQVRAVRKTLAAYRQRGFDKPGRLLVSDREHARIVQAIGKGDDVGAAEAMRVHIDVGGEAMVALVLAAGADAAVPAVRKVTKRG